MNMNVDENKNFKNLYNRIRFPDLLIRQYSKKTFIAYKRTK